jgi:hypothetical protein
VGSADVNIGVQVFLLYADLDSFTCIPRISIAKYMVVLFLFFSEACVLIFIEAEIIYINTNSIYMFLFLTSL